MPDAFRFIMQVYYGKKACISRSIVHVFQPFYWNRNALCFYDYCRCPHFALSCFACSRPIPLSSTIHLRKLFSSENSTFSSFKPSWCIRPCQMAFFNKRLHKQSWYHDLFCINFIITMNAVRKFIAEPHRLKFNINVQYFQFFLSVTIFYRYAPVPYVTGVKTFERYFVATKILFGKYHLLHRIQALKKKNGVHLQTQALQPGFSCFLPVEQHFHFCFLVFPSAFARWSWLA